MFGWFKRDPVKQLRKQYHAKLEAAMQSQRNGNMREYAFLTAEAEEVRKELEAAEA